MKDVRGRETAIGDIVAFVLQNTRKLTTGKVVKITPSGVRISYKYKNHIRDYDTFRRSGSFAVLEKDIDENSVEEAPSRHTPSFGHILCSCGGVIGIYNRSDLKCIKCHKDHSWDDIRYDTLITNSKTGWRFPVLCFK